ncbi:MAG: c-type cytochrome, partial [Prosthecobacter sp.]|nr:c-type cytochrome [Prosthecobacter sp.]
WKGATFDWAGPDVGYIVQVKPKGFKAPALPDFAKLSEKELVLMLDLTKPESYRRRSEAQRELLRRNSKMTNVYERQFNDMRNPVRNLIDQIRAMATGEVESELERFVNNEDPVIAHTAIRALAARNKPEEIFLAMSIVLSHQQDNMESWVEGMLKALAMLHSPNVVEFLVQNLEHETNPHFRQSILAALCRLHFTEGEWKGDSWGTRPDTRGPYYQPEAWSETEKIAAVLKETLSKATPEETAFLVKEMNRNRIQSDDALQRILTLAQQDPKVIPDAVAQLSVAETIPASAIPMLVGVLKSTPELQLAKTPKDQTTSNPSIVNPAELKLSSTLLSQAIIALTKTDSADGAAATLSALAPLQKMEGAFKDYEAASTTFFNSPKLENHHQLIEQIAEKLDGQTSRYADAALLNLSARTSGSPESRELSQKALDLGWQDTQRRIQILEAIGSVKHQAAAPKVLAAMDDADPKVKAVANRTAKALKLTKVEDKTPKIATLTPEATIEAVMKTKGDLALGEQLFTRATCVACHTTTMEQAQKGPYLGNIAQTYKRAELAQNILDPNKTIAQGFASELITMKDGTQQMGFITLEGANEVKLRNIAAQEFTFKTTDIKERQKLPTSMMPPGLMMNFSVREFASLLDYLEALAKAH